MAFIINPGALNNFQGGPIRFVDITQNVQPSHNVIAPAGIIAGDLLFYIDASNEAGVPEHVPTGFTIRKSLSLGNHRLILSEKLAVGTESGATLTGLTATSKTTAALLHFSCTNANNDYPIAVSMNEFFSFGEMINTIPLDVNHLQTVVNNEWGTFDSALGIVIWHASPSIAWTDVHGSANEDANGVEPFLRPWNYSGDAVPQMRGASYDLSNSDSNIGLRMSWVTQDAGRRQGAFGTGGLSVRMGFLSDVGDANATITAMYQPAPAGA